MTPLLELPFLADSVSQLRFKVEHSTPNLWSTNCQI